MAKKKLETLKKEVRKSLIEQLKAKGADVSVYMDQIEDYMTMWTLKCRYAEALNDPELQTSLLCDKDFMPAKQFPIINRQMLALLKQMEISPETIVKDGEDYGSL